jgi:hypothetical protein
MSGDDDNGGVLGNLPRARPGRRSGKRPAAAAERAAERAERTGAPGARPAPGAGAERNARLRPETPSAADGDVVGEAVRAAASVAEAGLRVASGLTREVLRRLPRP